MTVELNNIGLTWWPFINGKTSESTQSFPILLYSNQVLAQPAIDRHPQVFSLQNCCCTLYSRRGLKTEFLASSEPGTPMASHFAMVVWKIYHVWKSPQWNASL
jgi:hypothetical protein